MKKEEAKKIIQENLVKMGCSDISFLETKEDVLSVVFNCQEITSFVTIIEGWVTEGIQLNTREGHQFKIDFKIKS